MWSLLIKVASLGKGALVVSVAASAVMVSSADLATGPAHHDTPPAVLAAAATTTKKTELTVPVAKPATTEPQTEKSEKTEPKTEKTEPKTEETEPKTEKNEKTEPKTEPKTEKTEHSKGHDEIPGVVKECIEKYHALRAQGDAASKGDRQSTEAVCKAALELTGLTTAEFWAKFGTHTGPTAPTAPKTEAPTTVRTLENWIKECVTKYTIKAPDATEFCRKATLLSGLTSAEFAAKYLHQTTTGTTTPPVATPKPVTNTAELSQLVAKCVQLYTAVLHKTTTDTHAASEACGIAIRASGLTSAQFAAKYLPTQN